MEERKDKKRTTLTLGKAAGKTLSVKERSVEQKSVKAGNTKTVTVEVKRSKSIKLPDKGDEQAIENILRSSNLTSEEFETRLKVLKEAQLNRQLQEEEKKKEEIRRRLEEKQVEEVPEEAQEEVQEETAPVIEEEVFPALSEEKKFTEEKKPEKLAAKPQGKFKKIFDEDFEEEVRKKPEDKVSKESKKSAFKLKVYNIEENEEEEAPKFHIPKRRKTSKHKAPPAQKIAREVILPDNIVVADLANRMSEKTATVVKELMKLGVMVNVNASIDADTAELVISALGHSVKRAESNQVEKIIEDIEDKPEALQPRPPVVTIMGHVDHGKTSLLDAIRQTDIVAGEAGGITQHIGAYQITTESGQKITFIDTPGHEAFTAMRARGASATDIVILVVAADDGIMAQTIEAINHAKAAGVPIIVAINKIDKPGADPSRVKNELLNQGLVVEEFGGDVMAVEVSAKEKLNLDKLEEVILLQAEVMELTANPNRAARGIVVESRVDKGKGIVATLLVQKGTLQPGDIVVAGTSWGKIRMIYSDKGESLQFSTPSTPVEILGLQETPEAGDIFAVVGSEKEAREIVDYRKEAAREMVTTSNKVSSIEEFLLKSAENKKRELALIVKADVHGSMEAINASIAKLSNDEVTLKVIHSAIGGITESDVRLAEAARAVILGFNVRANAASMEAANKSKIDIKYYSIIYDLIDDLKNIVTGMLQPKMREEYIGNAEIRQVFNVTKVGKIAGCYVTNGIIKRGAGVRLLRDNVVIHEGKLKTLRRFKDDVKEVKEGFECGIAFENYDNILEGDILEAFEIVQ